ncbi:probable RNA polymerase II nuclear localization protein SLC7A6OS isoform X1 [Phymastichus coffea]|uniref:probable RNA polymerase II nuclear localization protein SLC7A6OS isoform X1 n=1 Tax=Phymastichus coffea TaxID=108790 RepID=UPI00273ADFD8|nr:probable RNA polymerase II nuclear localization protein SLC7A6OS isoform X1 [Phymastichus coffea]
MAAILRVKRKKDDEPQDALIISCKRPKVEYDDVSESSAVTAIVKFAGTIEKPDDCVVEHITKTLSKEALKSHFKQHIVDITKKVREKTKQESNENRYKIISNIRSLDTSMIDDLDQDVINVIDIEDTKAVQNDKSDTGYVYDLYYTQTKDAIRINDLVSVLPAEENLVFEDYYRDNEEEYREESEDSNSESNWKNEYPDSEYSEESVEENDMRNAMKKLNVDNELSSDDDDDNDFVYGLDKADVERYGYKYAKYKAQLKKEEKEEYDFSITDRSSSSDNDGRHNSDEIDEFDHEDMDQ